MATIIEQKVPNHPVLFIYSDGRPDHRLTYLSVKLQALALAQEKMPEEMEALAVNCNSLKALRKFAEGKPQFRDACLDALSPVKVLLSDVVRRLELNEKKFEVFTAATEDELDEFWTSLSAIDQEFQLCHNKKMNAKNVTPGVAEFISHCCCERHYFFNILKCGRQECAICSTPTLPASEFTSLSIYRIQCQAMMVIISHLMWSLAATPRYHPSKLNTKQKGLPFNASVQLVKRMHR